MTANVNNSQVYTDFSALTALKGKAAGKPSEATLREVASQFESLFIQMMLQSMRDASGGEGLFDSQEGDVYRDMFDKQVAIDMSKHQGIGLAEMLVRQLRQGGVETTDGAVTPAPMGLSKPVASFPLNSEPSAPAAQWSVTDKQDFVAKVWPHAQRAGQELGVKPEVLVAQAALETGWGQSMMQQADGRPAFNFFGIKADAGWNGARVAVSTLEHDPDRGLTRRSAAFRAYGSIGEGFADYVSFIKSNPRYQGALAQAGDASAYVTELHRAGYATDPQYSHKINKIMDGNALRPELASSSGRRG